MRWCRRLNGFEMADELASRDERKGLFYLASNKSTISEVYESMQCVYAKLNDPSILINDTYRCEAVMRVGGDPRWIEKRHDTILVNYN